MIDVFIIRELLLVRGREGRKKGVNVPVGDEGLAGAEGVVGR